MNEENEMLSKETRCWICKRTENEIIKEVKDSRIFNCIRKSNKNKYVTKGCLISLEDVHSFNYPVCGICKELIKQFAYEIADSVIEDANEDCVTYEEISELRLVNKNEL